MNTTTMTLGRTGGPLGAFTGRSWYDWLFAALVLAGGAFAFTRYAGAMDVYEKAILIGAMPAAIALGWFWGSLRTLMIAVGTAPIRMAFSYTSIAPA